VLEHINKIDHTLPYHFKLLGMFGTKGDGGRREESREKVYGIY
jgi:hypothetical protein